MKDFIVALDLLRGGNDDMMREMYPDLHLVFDLIELKNDQIEELTLEVERLQGELDLLQ